MNSKPHPSGKTQREGVFKAVIEGVGRDKPSPTTNHKEESGNRFLKRHTALSKYLSRKQEEKTFYWINPEKCRMWKRHNRAYKLLTPSNCSDLIEGIKAQGRQEFPAIARRLEGEEFDYEVICGARRHFAVSWLRENNYTQFQYLVEVRDLSDEEAFRLADIENRNREDISDFERALDYAEALKLYYRGQQKAMAERLEVSESWLSRYLQLTKLPEEIVEAFTSVRDIRERHARDLRTLLREKKSHDAMIKEAKRIVHSRSLDQRDKNDSSGAKTEAKIVVNKLLRAGREALFFSREETKSNRKTEVLTHLFSSDLWPDCKLQRKGKRLQLEFPERMNAQEFRRFTKDFINAYYD